MTEPTPVSETSGSAAAERAVLRTALRDGLILVGALAVLGAVVGALVAGTPGVWGALVGAAVVAFFSGVTVWSMLFTIGKSAATTGAVVMGSWLAKMIVLIVVLSVLTRTGTEWLTPGVRGILFGVVALGTIGSALLDYRAVHKGRVPYVSPQA